MTKEEIYQFINYLAHFPITYPLATLEDGHLPEDARKRWINDASIEWLDTVLEAMQNLPTTFNGEIVDQEYWYYQFASMLEDWIVKEPVSAIAKIGPMITISILTEHILFAFTQCSHPNCMPWLRSVMPHLGELNEDALSYLINALTTQNTQESLALIREIDNQLSIKTEIIQGALDWSFNKLANITLPA